jgi:hypothetical protein
MIIKIDVLKALRVFRVEEGNFVDCLHGIIYVKFFCWGDQFFLATSRGLGDEGSLWRRRP